MLAADGKLRPADPVRQHLPEFPEFEQVVTIDHLMRNSSGLRDMLELSRMGGMDLSFPAEQAQLVAAITRQRTLNFPPGSRFLYSNSNFLILGLIVERLTGQSLPDFLAARIFGPLGMTRTAMVPRTNAVVPDLATGYFPREGGGFVRAQHAYPLGGEGGLVSCVEDLALWNANLDDGRVGGEALPAALAEQAAFTNGRLNVYARGQAVEGYRGEATVSHGGLWPGYKTQFLRLPRRGLTVICIANLSNIDPAAIARRAVDAALDAERVLHPVPAMPAPEALQTLDGRWLHAETGATAEFAVENGGVTLKLNGVPSQLGATQDGRLTAGGTTAFTVSMPQGDTLEAERSAGHRETYRRVTAEATLPADLQGRYACEELATTWTIGADGVRVAGPVVNTGPWDVQPIEGDIIRVVVPGVLLQSWLDVVVQRQVGRVTGLLVSGGRAKNLRFARVA
jgi:hypothetical protein